MAIWLAVTAGALTGYLDAIWFRQPVSGARSLIGLVLGAIVGAASYWAFIIFGLAVSVLSFNSEPDPTFALICVGLGCVSFLGLRWVHAAISSRLGVLVDKAGRGDVNLNDVIRARPQGGAPTMWLGGIVAPILIGYYGLQCIVTGRAEWGRTLWRDEVTGAGAIALGAAWIGIALVLHSHFFLGLRAASAKSQTGKRIGIGLAAAGFLIAGLWSMRDVITSPATAQAEESPARTPRS